MAGSSCAVAGGALGAGRLGTGDGSGLDGVGIPCTGRGDGGDGAGVPGGAEVNSVAPHIPQKRFDSGLSFPQRTQRNIPPGISLLKSARHQ